MSAEGLLLLVEDDGTTREVLALLLEADGWAVRGAESGEEAMEALQDSELRPGVILCDLHLPGRQGSALAAALRPVAGGAFLIAMSASEPGAEGATYDAVLRKPFGPAELNAVLEGLQATNAAGRIADAAAAVEGTAEGDFAEGDRDEQESDLPVLVMETFLKLEQQMGGRAKDLYAFALADAGDRLRRMEQHLKRGDTAALQSEAHQLKGSAGMIGAQRLAFLASEAERNSGGHYLGKKVQEMHLACDEIHLMLETLFPM